ncbi:hypothetical protein [Chelatococcus reniformis]|uniref:Uncharacterized protein n=1 Tax=Chelatococcus reniformis TaxID=1494448 RepID=A0A916XPW0_9HYPH|nr:hypothetical protein [Chelatococcus reniformis]GGC90647.1 hypothetical protein GCM10010994_55550 [Chelatococcus reniformis]
MNSFAEVIDALGGPVKFGAAVGVPDSHARTMKARNSIPAEYWPTVVSEAEKLGVEAITYESLAVMFARSRGKLPSPEAA